MCEFLSQSYTYLSWSSPLTMSLRKLRRASLDLFEAYADKGNFISSKRERSSLRNFFLISEFISQTYKLDFRKQFANTLFVESVSDIWEIIGAHGEKGNFLRLKLERSPVRNCIALCECNSQSYTFLFSDQFVNTVFWKSAFRYYIAQ